MIVIHKIKIDMQASAVPEVVNVVQLDSNTRVIQAALYSGNVPFEIGNNASVSLACFKPDRTKCWYDELPNGNPAASVEGNVVSITLAPEVLTAAGSVNAAIVIREGLTDQISTFPFWICVARNPAAGSIISNNYYKVSDLESLNSWMKEVLCCTPQEWTAEQQAQARANIGAMAAGIQKSLAINSTGDTAADVVLESELRESGTAAMQFYSGGADVGAEHHTILGGLADGENDTDAATVGQVKEMVSQSGGGTVKTVNGVAPDENGNVEIETGGDSVAEKYFDIDYDGIVSLKPEYRGHPAKDTYPYAISENGVGVDGSKIDELPEKIVIPNVIEGTAVTGFQAGIFYGNEKVKELTIPDVVEELPECFCRDAINLKTVNGTENIIKVTGHSFAYTRVEKLLFPNLKEMASMAFGACNYLYSIDIGNNITEIPAQAFQQCCKLSLVKGGGKVTKIGDKAFYITVNLKNLPFLSKVTSIGVSAFYKSRIQFDWDSIKGQCTFGNGATPVMDNTTDYWTGVEYTPCKNRIVTVMSQKNEAWKDEIFGETGRTYYNGCAVFSVLHIHSALSGKVYTHPDEFAEEVRAINPKYVTTNHPREFENAVSLLQDLGYKTTVYKDDNSQESYQAICEALARGAYVYTNVSTANDVHGGHAVALYGMNGNGEVLVVDPDSMYEKYRATGVTDDVQKYRIPLQNLTGPGRDSIIVEKA